MDILGIIVGSDVNDTACASICQWAGHTFDHSHC